MRYRDITRKLDEQREQLVFVKRSDFNTVNSREGTGAEWFNP